MGFKITPNVAVMCFPYSVERRVTTARAAPATLSHSSSESSSEGVWGRNLYVHLSKNLAVRMNDKDLKEDDDSDSGGLCLDV